jgi:two-component system, sensor histidine kinase and response regulator
MEQAKILVIDDEMGIREGCKRALVPRGYAVETAADGDAGLQIIKSNNIDLALIDIVMPGISGIELITLIHEHDPDIICIIITGYATVELAVTAIKQGAYDFLTKPFTMDDLLLIVNRGIERRTLSLEAKRLQKIEEEAKRLAEDKARLEELDKAKVAFIRLVTHELQAPINAISTYIDLILNGYIPPEEIKEFLERAQTRAKEQIKMITDLLEYGRLKEVKTVGVPEIIQMDTVLIESIEQLKAEAKEKKLEISTEIPANLPPIYMIAEQVKSVWTNLISNAIKFTPTGGKIYIGLRKVNSHLQGYVRDNGIGIPDDAKDKIFSDFYRAKNAKSLNIPGTGLGLAIVKHIVEKAEGKIWYESEIGSGSSFYFSLPIAGNHDVTVSQ